MKRPSGQLPHAILGHSAEGFAAWSRFRGMNSVPSDFSFNEVTAGSCSQIDVLRGTSEECVRTAARRKRVHELVLDLRFCAF